MPNEYLFTSESVSHGHPDKICDQVSDAILDAHLAVDPNARVAVECMALPNRLIIGGETRCEQKLDSQTIEKIARNVIKRIGYNQEGFNWQDLHIETHINRQSPDIALGVDNDGAGDQGMMFGYACNETDALMPAPIFYANRILENLFEHIENESWVGFGPDAKCQVTILYRNGKPVCTKTIVLSLQHPEGFTSQDILELVKPHIESSLPDGWICPDENLLVNPTGKFVIGGPAADCGLTGRKIIVDTYGGAAPHGGGAFSGKDSTKVDRSAAYMARYLAKNVVASGVAEKCTIQISYAIGVAQPVSVFLDTHNTSSISDDIILSALEDAINLEPKEICKYLKLNQPIYLPTATYGHFGREPNNKGHFSWENTELAEHLKNCLI